MKRNFKSYIYLLFLAAALSACKKDFYNLQPYDASPVDQSIKTDADLNVMANGMYASLRNVDLYGRTLPVKGDLAADNVYLRTGNSGRYLVFRDFNETVANTEANTVWAGAYSTVKDANLIINSSLESTA